MTTRVEEILRNLRLGHEFTSKGNILDEWIELLELGEIRPFIACKEP